MVVIPPEFADPALRLTDDSAPHSIALQRRLGPIDGRQGPSDRHPQYLAGRLGSRSSWPTLGIDVELLNPFQLADIDIAPERTREAAFWSKLLPFIMLVWAMTGAFYPAIDLVAGEKERGTLETLLCSPALRSEIVWGKLGAVTTFSMLTAMLNAGSMLVTSSFVFRQMGVGGGGGIGAPPIVPMLWLLVALVPLSALFSALALAVAAMARSSKEGQYYLMPLMMVTLPLVLLPMLPGTTLSAGTSLIPVTGMFLLVRALVEGQYGFALLHLPMVFGVTAGCLWLATNWARRQFEDESVLFGGRDQWELSMWVRHLWRDRQTAATPGQAFACGAIILVALFFGKLAVTEMPEGPGGHRQTDLDATNRHDPGSGPADGDDVDDFAAKESTTSHAALDDASPCRAAGSDAASDVRDAGRVDQLHVSGQRAGGRGDEAVHRSDSLGALDDRGLSDGGGARHLRRTCLPRIHFRWLGARTGRLRAVVITALMFGISHGVLQQSIAATIMGLLLGWIALRTGSVLPGILIHFTNNALSVSLERIAEQLGGG